MLSAKAVHVYDHEHVNVHEIPRLWSVTGQAPNTRPPDADELFLVYVAVDVIVHVDVYEFIFRG